MPSLLTALTREQIAQVMGAICATKIRIAIHIALLETTYVAVAALCWFLLARKGASVSILTLSLRLLAAGIVQLLHLYLIRPLNSTLVDLVAGEGASWRWHFWPSVVFHHEFEKIAFMLLLVAASLMVMSIRRKMIGDGLMGVQFTIDLSMLTYFSILWCGFGGLGLR